MSYQAGHPYYKQFLVINSSGLPFDAWLMPRAVLVRNGVDDLSAETYVSYNSLGRYTVSGIIPYIYKNGDDISIYIYHHVKLEGDPNYKYKDTLIDLGRIEKPIIY